MSQDDLGLGDPRMLQCIDKLMACGVNALINLPQIVVIGDQSSGKSSVLAGLIRQDLPRDSGLCTRFATHIVFRRARHQSISASIIAGEDATEKHKSEVEAWKMANLTSLEGKEFSQMMKAVHEVMGLSDGHDALGKPTFSNDVFRLEISGPEQEHLSVIDVPGIFKNTTPGITTKADIELVRNMVLGYMENPRSVMLTVVPANVDVATQEVLELAHDVDPDGDRTLGVLTKPDLVDAGAEDRVIDLIEGRVRSTKLGWHVVRNPGQQHLNDSSLDRFALEMSFFNTKKPWDAIDRDKVGVEKLRGRLKDVLSRLVRREFPKVKREIKARLEGATKSVNEIGQERSNPHAQRSYLIELSVKFQRLVMLALTAKYGADEMFESFDALRIAPAVTARYTQFSKDMELQGHRYGFKNGSDLDSALQHTASDNIGPELQSDLNIKGNHVEEPAVECSSEIDEYKDELGDILPISMPIDEVDTDGIGDWLQDEYKKSRGFELGTFDSSILVTTMKKHLPWQQP